MSALSPSRSYNARPSLDESSASLERRIRRFLVDRRFPTVKAAVSDEQVTLSGTAGSIYERQVLALSIGRLVGEREIVNQIEIEDFVEVTPTSRQLVWEAVYSLTELAGAVPRSLYGVVAVLVLIPAVWAASNSLPSGNHVRVYRVTGKLLVNGEPATGALVVLHPQGHQLPPGAVPTGVVKADGAFKVVTDMQGEGAPVGDYVATVTWINLPGAGSSIPEEYLTAASSPVKFTVRAEQNTLPSIEITSKKPRVR